MQIKFENYKQFIFFLRSTALKYLWRRFGSPPRWNKKKSPIKTRLPIEGVAPKLVVVYINHILIHTYISLFTLHLYRTYKKNCCEMSSVRRLHLIYIFVVVDAMQIIS